MNECAVAAVAAAAAAAAAEGCGRHATDIARRTIQLALIAATAVVVI